jgi:hypothetical protein
LVKKDHSRQAASGRNLQQTATARLCFRTTTPAEMQHALQRAMLVAMYTPSSAARVRPLNGVPADIARG